MAFFAAKYQNDRVRTMENRTLIADNPYNRVVQPPASAKALDDPIYEAFYGFTEQPFAITTDPRFFFLSEGHQYAYNELRAGLLRREGLLLVTGETGSGKTTLCRTVIQSLGERTFTAMILNPYMAGAEVLRIVLRDFGIITHEELRHGAVAKADIPQLLDTLEGFLLSLLPLDTHAVIVIDEAQSLPPIVLDQIRMLTAFEQDGKRLVQIVLGGQPTLLNTLKSEPMYALNERVTRRVVLGPLNPNEVEAYITHRLTVAGGAEAVRFQPEAARIVAELSRGLPRRVNVLCDRALQEGRIEGASVITSDLVKRAAKALAGAPAPAGPVLVAPSTPRELPKEPARAESPLDSPLAHVPTLTFGQPAETASSTRWRRVLLTLFGALAMAGAIGYGYFARSLLNALEAPQPPPPPAQTLGALARPASAPGQDEVVAILEQLVWPTTGTVIR
jgi:type II secretory pathway predicted ATPase ExeA